MRNLPPSCAVVTKSGNLNFLEPSGPVQACNGTALPFYMSMPIPVALRSKARFVESRVRFPLRAWMFDPCVYCVLGK